jgi:hypothetical protein
MSRPTLADLVLLRLLPAKKSVGPKDLRKDLGAVFRRAPSPDEIATTITALRAEGFIAPKRGTWATDAGRARALQFLGVEKLPPRANWQMVRA